MIGNKIVVFGLLALLAAPTATLAQPAMTDHTSPGGIAFRHGQMPRAQFQSLQFGWRNSYAVMLPGKTSIGSMGPAMIMNGPKGSTRGEFVEDGKDLAARFSLSAGTHFTLGTLTTPPDKFEAAIDLLARTLSEPALEPRRLDELRRAMLLGIKRAEANPQGMGGRTTAILTLPEGPLRNWMVGNPAIIASVTMDDIEAWRKAVLVREGLIVATVGPLSATEAGQQIDRLFANLPAKGTVVMPQLGQARAIAKTIVLETPAAQTTITLSVPSRFLAGPDITRGHLAMSIFRTRLFDAVRVKLGASYGASAQLSAAAYEPYTLSAQTLVEHDKAPAALDAMREQYAALLAKGITAQELEPEKTKLISSFQESMRRPEAVAASTRTIMLENYPADYLAKNGARIAAITADAVNADLKEKLGEIPVLVMIVAPSAAPFKADCVIRAIAEVERCR